VRSVEDSIKRGTVRLRNPQTDSRNAAQAVTLLETIEEFKFDACIGGAPRRRKGPRQGTHLLLPRRIRPMGPKAQRPELWDLYNTRVHPGENMRVFPISNWTELDVWQYIAREKLELPRSTSPTSAR
jgi:sulfate adenylyltransferase subunit 2